MAVIWPFHSQKSESVEIQKTLAPVFTAQFCVSKPRAGHSDTTIPWSIPTRYGLRILEFHEMTEAWLDFIINCRHGISHDYDIVIGAMANDQIYNFIADYIDGIITREQFWVMAKFKYPTHQINFCTEAALNCLTFVGSEEVKV